MASFKVWTQTTAQTSCSQIQQSHVARRLVPFASGWHFDLQNRMAASILQVAASHGLSNRAIIHAGGAQNPARGKVRFQADWPLPHRAFLSTPPPPAAGGSKSRVARLPLSIAKHLFHPGCLSTRAPGLDETCLFSYLNHVTSFPPPVSPAPTLRSENVALQSDGRGFLCAALSTMEEISRTEAGARDMELEAEGRKLQVVPSTAPLLRRRQAVLIWLPLLHRSVLRRLKISIQ